MPWVTSMTLLQSSGSASTHHRSALNGQAVQHKAPPSTGALLKLALAEAAVEETEEDDDQEEPAMVEFLQEGRCDSKGRLPCTTLILGSAAMSAGRRLCGEEDCKRCGEGDLKQPCLDKMGKMEEVRKSKNWMYPHCIEEKGIKKFWICNISICLKKRKISLTRTAIYDAREEGYESVAHLLMDRLKRQAF